MIRNRDVSKQAPIDELMKELGEQVRNERVRQRIEQADLAKRAGIPRSALSRIENGQGATLRTFVAALRALGKDAWIATLSPRTTVRPMELLAGNREPPRRVRMRKDDRTDEEES